MNVRRRPLIILATLIIVGLLATVWFYPRTIVLARNNDDGYSTVVIAERVEGFSVAVIASSTCDPHGCTFGTTTTEPGCTLAAMLYNGSPALFKFCNTGRSGLVAIGSWEGGGR